MAISVRAWMPPLCVALAGAHKVRGRYIISSNGINLPNRLTHGLNTTSQRNNNKHFEQL
jgi:hypothetical protein